MANTFPRGAEWRVWDFQVHTPFSELNNGFGSDLESYARRFFLGAIENEVAVVGVTDYFSIEGYVFLRNLQADRPRLSELLGDKNADAAAKIVLFANVELRSNILVNGNRVNYHVIFSNEVDVEDISNNFLAQLQFSDEGIPSAVDQQLPLTRSNLTAFGKRLKSQHAEFADKSDLFVGMMQATVDHRLVSEVLERQQATFAGNYLFCVPSDEDLSEVSWNGQGHAIRKILVQKSHLLFTSNKSTRDFALGFKHSTPDAYIAEFNSLKPCVHGSDAHNFEELFRPKEGRLTWIKADPTFRGLKQVVNEPRDRVFIGVLPPALEAIRSRPTKIVQEITVSKKIGSALSEKWFDQTVPLNPELVAIIGNKGSGKSALADILGLLGNTPRHHSFSFLSDRRFNERKQNKAKHFEASILWADDKVDGPVSLSDLPRPSSVETIKYIPQDYLETICNEVVLGSGSKFYEELQTVIFSHVSDAEKLGFSRLDDLLAHRSQETKKAIEFLIGKLQGINLNIVECDDRLTEGYRKSLEAQIVAKQREIDAHERARPAAPTAVEQDPIAVAAALAVGTQLQAVQQSLLETEQKIVEANNAIVQETRRRSLAERLLGKVVNFEKLVNAAEEDAESESAELGIEWTQLVQAKVNKAPVEAVIAKCSSDLAVLRASVDPELPTSLLSKQGSIQKSIAELTLKLNAPQRAEAQYKAALKQWEKIRNDIVGSADLPGSLEGFKSELASIPKIKEREQELRRERVDLVREIFKEKLTLRDDYSRYYGAVQSFLAEHPIAKGQQFRLTFNVAIAEQGFSQGFVRLLNQRKTGTFSGVDEGAQRLREMLDGSEFNTADGVTKFLSRIVRALKEDLRPGKGGNQEIRDQLAQGVTLVNLYDFLFSLSYLDPIYSLQWDGKTLEQLSPGERGNLLLIFYLLIDRDTIPLVIDQPEENLDNNTIYKTLVPCVREAKARRQIIMVTHNPNLAVVCDAEQVICASIQKKAGNEVRYVCGSIEDVVVNKQIVDVLEGTKPAFLKRDSKYFL